MYDTAKLIVHNQLYKKYAFLIIHGIAALIIHNLWYRHNRRQRHRHSFAPGGRVRNFEIILKNSWDSTDILFEATRLAGEGEIPTRVNKVAACGNGK